MSDDLIRRLDGILVAVQEGAAEGLFFAGEHILEVSNRHIPIEEGTLQRSGKVTVDKGTLEAAVSYSTPYAVPQHEDLTLRHDPGRTAKYLERIADLCTNVAEMIVFMVRGVDVRHGSFAQHRER